MAVPYTFGTATAAIPLSQLDSNFATTITLGNTAIQLGNTVTTLNNMTLANVTVSSGNLTLTNVSATLANVTTANIGTAVITGGRLLVGTTSVSNGSLSNFYFNSFSNGIETTWAGTNSIYHVLAINGNGFLGGINTSGSTTTYTNLSDYRVKENIEPMQNALSKVSLLKPCTFTYKVDGKDGQGFIAHELQEIFPDAVVGNKDAIDNDGNPVYQAIDTSFLVATLTAAIQEQQALIASLTARIAALEAK